MSMRDATRWSKSPPRARIPAALPRLLIAGLLGIGAALLVSCGTSGKGLIPTGNAGPLQSDFEAVARDAQNGNGRCAATEAAIAKTEQDFGTLPATVDAGLRSRLREGITNLRTRALEVCAQPLPQATVTTTTPRTSTSTQTTSTTPTVTTDHPRPPTAHDEPPRPPARAEERRRPEKKFRPKAPEKTAATGRRQANAGGAEPGAEGNGGGPGKGK